MPEEKKEEVVITTTREEQQKVQLAEQSKREWMSYSLNVPDSLLEKIPKSKHQETIDSAKNEIILKEMMRARELLVELNSSARNQKVAALSLQYRNLCRQLVWNEVRLKQIEDKQEVLDGNGKPVYSFELKYLIDKLVQDKFFIEQDLILFGCNKEEVLENL